MFLPTNYDTLLANARTYARDRKRSIITSYTRRMGSLAENIPLPSDSVFFLHLC